MGNINEKYQNRFFRYTKAVVKKPVLAVKSSLELKPCHKELSCEARSIAHKVPKRGREFYIIYLNVKLLNHKN